MSAWIWILGAFFIIGVVVGLAAISPVVLQLHYVHHQGADRVTIDFRGLWGIITKRWVLGGEEALQTVVERAVERARNLDEGPGASEPEAGPEQRVWAWRRYVKTGKRIARLWRTQEGARHALTNFLKRVHIKTCRAKVRIGTGEAASTGVVVGVLWSFFYGMAALLARRVGHVSPEARVDPDFQRRLIEVEFEGIAQFRAGQAIRAGVAMAIAFWKEGLLWRITQSKT
ncbi:DUF2953 domain-containing protein [Kyrpidia tusciae]|uniref:DUF2953 domain-containing protein n=1 Tax=Kyrpidia tusciae (strain DSM 2912 / NBRC 15312 / T2) TaxID=562970 RepID=D5WQB0_KYRT2|nr:DUF2953 domain-containing protein [Kyrpidia tusciae]ADG06519.1 hypothetical protein Btus_1819 [Kyrpidia tusciae DSM 2912]